MSNNLGMIDRGEHGASQGESYEDLDQDADAATPGEHQQDRRQHGDKHGPRQDLGQSLGTGAAVHDPRLPQQHRGSRQLLTETVRARR